MKLITLLLYPMWMEREFNQKCHLTTSATKQINTFDEFTFYEKEEIRLLAAGTQWFGEKITLI